MTTETLDAMTSNLASEGDVPSLADFAEEPGGALTPGWYAAEIIEGYTTRKAGKVFTTSDNPSGKGDSRNFRICVNVQTGSAEPRQMQESLNYRPSDFTPERLAYIAQARQDHKGVQGRWNDDPDGQRSSLAVAKFGMLEKAIGTLRTADGVIAAKAIGQKLDVYVGIKDGFNELTKFAKAGDKAKRAA